MREGRTPPPTGRPRWNSFARAIAPSRGHAGWSVGVRREGGRGRLFGSNLLHGVIERGTYLAGRSPAEAGAGKQGSPKGAARE